MNYEFLDRINCPENLKELDEKNIPALCQEIRDYLVDSARKSGGHLASNLGVVELTVALHRIFNSPSDHIIFDVGHQSYVHKLITGRKKDFETLRRAGGLSGFTSRRESKHDPFGAGHSSTSISAALGFAEADALRGSDAYSVCVIGDGAYTGGMVHEALNNVKRDLRLVIILNENRMSISKNKGAFASYIAKIRMSGRYVKWKKSTDSVLRHIPLIGKSILSLLTWFKNKVKRVVYSNNYFEDLGLYYIGPVNGNDYATISKALTEAKKLGRSVIVHTYTKKGKGYEPAERAPEQFHGVSAGGGEKNSFHEVFAEELIKLAGSDENVVAITAAMGIGTGLEAFGNAFSNRYFDVGIAEEHALTFSAGLAASGLKPYVAIYSTFLQRGYDNILHDIALQRLPVRIMIDRAGLATADGATHHGIFDVAFLSHIPNLTVYSPATYGSLCEAMRLSQTSDSPMAIRYPNCAEDKRISERFYPGNDYSSFGAVYDFDIDKAPDNIFITYGNITSRVIDAADLLMEGGIRAGIILVERLKPYFGVVEAIEKGICAAKRIVFVEEGIVNGGFSMICADKLKEALSGKRYEIVGIDDNFAIPDSPTDLYGYLGMSGEQLSLKMKKMIEDND